MFVLKKRRANETRFETIVTITRFRNSTRAETFSPRVFIYVFLLKIAFFWTTVYTVRNIRGKKKESKREKQRQSERVRQSKSERQMRRKKMMKTVGCV